MMTSTRISDKDSVESGEISDKEEKKREREESVDESAAPNPKRVSVEKKSASTPVKEQGNNPRVFYGCSKFEDYEVSTAKHKVSNRVFALKKILVHNEKEGIPITALREIKILKSLSHPNIIELSEIAFEKAEKTSKQRGTLFMVFPYMDHDLTGLLENPGVHFTQPQIKCYIKQLLEGTSYLHTRKILHRDMKCSNILIDNQGNLKLADFGLARLYTPEKVDRDYTNNVVTRWYRPPELFLGETKYTAAVDMWGVGCVIGEIFKRKPILAGSSDVHQLELIFQLCGSPNEREAAYFKKMSGVDDFIETFKNQYPRSIKQRFERFDQWAVDLMGMLLQLNPSKRMTAEEALDHEYFFKDPPPATPESSDFISYSSSHEYDSRKRKQEQAQLMKHIQGASALVRPEPHYASSQGVDSRYKQ